jgi:hypothetical protein
VARDGGAALVVIEEQSSKMGMEKGGATRREKRNWSQHREYKAIVHVGSGGLSTASSAWPAALRLPVHG